MTSKTAGEVAKKSHHILLPPHVLLSPSIAVLPLAFVWQFPQNPLTYGYGINQNSKLQGIKYQFAQTAFEADPQAARLLILPARSTQGTPTTPTVGQGRCMTLQIMGNKYCVRGFT